MTDNITVSRELLRQAIESLEATCGHRCNAEYNPCHEQELVWQLRAALEQAPVQEAEKLNPLTQLQVAYVMGLRDANTAPQPEPVQEPDAVGCKCSVCGEWQRWTPSGMVCKNGHGGADGVNHRLYTAQPRKAVKLTLYSESQVKSLLTQADKDFSDGYMVVHLQVADQMRRKYEPVLRLAVDELERAEAIMLSECGVGVINRVTVAAIRKVLE